MAHTGSCHCGGITFEVEGEPERLLACNCSICAKVGALWWFVPRTAMTLTMPDAAVADYTFGQKTLHHRFCPVCGIHPYSEGAMPDGTPTAAINVRCLDGVEPDSFPVDHYDGRAL